MPFIILRNDYKPDSPRPKCFIGELYSGLACLHSCFLQLLLWADLAGFVTAGWLCGTDLFPLLVSCWGFFNVCVCVLGFFEVNFLESGKTGEFLYTIKHADCIKGR